MKEKAVSKIELFEKDPRNQSLHTHKLIGQLDELYSFRIVFIFEKSDEVTFVDIGTHSIYK